MTAISPSPNTIQEEEVKYLAAVSEGTMQRVGAAINYIGTFAYVNGSTSTSCGLFSDNSATTVAITNLSVVITTIGRPVLINVQQGPLTPGGMSFGNTNDAVGFNATIQIQRNGAPIVNTLYYAPPAGSTSVASVFFIDVPLAGTYTYAIYVNTTSTQVYLTASNMVVAVYQL